MPGPTPLPSRRREFLAGCRDESPILLGVAPFGMIYGVLALGAALDALRWPAARSRHRGAEGGAPRRTGPAPIRVAGLAGVVASSRRA